MKRSEKFTFKSINNNGSYFKAEHGLCSEIVNLRRHGGEPDLKVVGPKAQKDGVTPITSNTRKFYIHSTATGNKWIVYELGNIKYKYDNAGVIAEKEIQVMGVDKDIEFNHSNNILIIFNHTDKEINYALYRENTDDYAFFDKIPDALQIDFHGTREIDWDDALDTDVHGTTYFGYTAGNAGYFANEENFPDDWVWTEVSGNYKGYPDLFTAAYLAKRDTWRKNNKTIGWVLCTAAYELYDGSYVSISPVKLIYVGNEKSVQFRVYKSDTNTDWLSVLTGLTPGKIQYSIRNIHDNSAIITDLKNTYSDIIKKLCLFITEPFSMEGFNADSYKELMLTDQKGSSRNESGALINLIAKGGAFGVYTPVSSTQWDVIDLSRIEAANKSLKTIINSRPAFYLAQEINIDDLVTSGTLKDLQVGDYNTLTAKRALDTSNLASYQIYGENHFTYNGRLIVGGNVRQKFPNPMSPDLIDGNETEPTPSADNGQINFNVEIQSGITKENRQKSDIREFTGDLVKMPFFFAYNDVRAFKSRVEVLYDDDYFTVAKLPLTPHDLLNMSFFVFSDDAFDSRYFFSSFGSDHFRYSMLYNTVYDVIYGGLPASNWDYIEKTNGHRNEDVYFTQRNKIHISDVENPLSFLAKNTYLVGNGDILGFQTNSTPASVGQFGSYPLIVFTDKGIFAMNISRDANFFIDSIVPLNGLVPVDKDIVNFNGVIYFKTRQGIVAFAGNEYRVISYPMEGFDSHDIKGYTNFDFYYGHDDLIGLGDTLTSLSFEEYLKQFDSANDPFNAWDTYTPAYLGYSSKYDELIISNKHYDYSYVYNRQSNSWYKINETFDYFVDNYPECIGVRGNSMYDMDSEWNNVVRNKIGIVTRPMAFETNTDFTKVVRAALRCMVKVDQDNKHFSMYLFVSNDLKNWDEASVKQVDCSGAGTTNVDIPTLILERSHYSAKYFIIVIGGKVHKTSKLSHVDIDVIDKYSDKLR